MPPRRTLPLPGLSVFRENRFVIVVGEWIVEPGFDDRLVGFGRVAGGIHPHAGFPQSEVAQDAFDHCGLVDEGDDSHFVLAVGAQEWIGFPDFLDEFSPVATALRSVPVLRTGCLPSVGSWTESGGA